MKTYLKTTIYGIGAAMLFAQCSPQKSTETEEEVVVEEEAKTPSLTMLWESEATLETVESVLYDPSSGKIYTSNIFGQNPQEKDGNGTISILGTDGSIIEQTWVSGLNAPKGMATANGNLYVTDIDELVEINLESGEITNKWTVEGAEFLNDVASHNGVVYFTDMNTGKVHSYQDGAISTVSEGHDSINGIAVGADGTIYGLDASGLKKMECRWDYRNPQFRCHRRRWTSRFRRWKLCGFQMARRNLVCFCRGSNQNARYQS